MVSIWQHKLKVPQSIDFHSALDPFQSFLQSPAAQRAIAKDSSLMACFALPHVGGDPTTHASFRPFFPTQLTPTFIPLEWMLKLRTTVVSFITAAFRQAPTPRLVLAYQSFQTNHALLRSRLEKQSRAWLEMEQAFRQLFGLAQVLVRGLASGHESILAPESEILYSHDAIQHIMIQSHERLVQFEEAHGSPDDVLLGDPAIDWGQVRQDLQCLSSETLSLSKGTPLVEPQRWVERGAICDFLVYQIFGSKATTTTTTLASRVEAYCGLDLLSLADSRMSNATILIGMFRAQETTRDLAAAYRKFQQQSLNLVSLMACVPRGRKYLIQHPMTLQTWIQRGLEAVRSWVPSCRSRNDDDTTSLMFQLVLDIFQKLSLYHPIQEIFAQVRAFPVLLQIAAAAIENESCLFLLATLLINTAGWSTSSTSPQHYPLFSHADQVVEYSHQVLVLIESVCCTTQVEKESLREETLVHLISSFYFLQEHYLIEYPQANVIHPTIRDEWTLFYKTLNRDVPELEQFYTQLESIHAFMINRSSSASIIDHESPQQLKRMQSKFIDASSVVDEHIYRVVPMNEYFLPVSLTDDDLPEYLSTYPSLPQQQTSSTGSGTRPNEMVNQIRASQHQTHSFQNSKDQCDLAHPE